MDAQEPKKKKRKVVKKKKPTNVTTSPKHNEKPTLSIAFPSSVVSLSKKKEAKSMIVGQIARMCAVFRVSEIVVFSDSNEQCEMSRLFERDAHNDISFIMRLLMYAECPQYLRQDLIPFHQGLQHVGLLNPLATPHHMLATDRTTYREALILDRTGPNGNSLCNCGIDRPAELDTVLPRHSRVTVKMEDYDSQIAKATVTNRRAPTLPPDNTYWGYELRAAKSLGCVFMECPFGDYDLIIGTSERGIDVTGAEFRGFGEHKHAIVVFGGKDGLEPSIHRDKVFDRKDPTAVFDHWVNTCPNQGARTIRCEEAIGITLSALQNKL